MVFLLVSVFSWEVVSVLGFWWFVGFGSGFVDFGDFDFMVCGGWLDCCGFWMLFGVSVWC